MRFTTRGGSRRKGEKEQLMVIPPRQEGEGVEQIEEISELFLRICQHF